MTIEGTRTEADAVAEIALAAAIAGKAEPISDGDQDVYGVALPPGWMHQLIDSERWAASPRRPSGTVRVHDADGFTRAVTQRTSDLAGPPVVYADEEAMALVAILNDDHGAGGGWRDHRVELALRRRPEWNHWRGADGKMLEQEAFATHIEDGLNELTDPAPAVMLDLAQTFHATTAARFKGGHRLRSGARQFVYEEDIDASAGEGGEVSIPETLRLTVRPFFGSERVEVDARFRFQLRSGQLTLGYKLDRPYDVERLAFGTVRDYVADELSIVPIAGVAPTARS